MERDEGRVLTDEILIEIEREIRRIYAAAGVELMQTIDEHFAKFADKDKEMRQLLEQGKITAEQYKQWRLAYIGRGQRMEELRDKLAERVTRANETAIAYINDKTPTIYTLNRNFAAYQVEKASGKYRSFTLFDEATIRRLIMEHPDLMPYYPEKRALARGIDLAYGKKQILAAITSGILQGKNTRKIAADLRKRLVDMSVDSALRTARTAVTAAENGGREDTFQRAADMGIKVKYQWVATLDARTRREHGHADGQVREAGEPFDVGGEKLLFPGDKSYGASGWNLYNCRCSKTIWDKYSEKHPGKRRAWDSVRERWEIIPDMKFDEWQNWKREQNPEAWDYAYKVGKNLKNDTVLFEKHKAEFGENAIKTLAEMQQMKYIQPERWEMYKKYVRERRTGKVSSFASFDFFMGVKAKCDGLLVGTTTPDGIEIKSTSIHSVSRIIGSEWDRRDGVDFRDVEETLRNGIPRKTKIEKNGNRSTVYVGEKAQVSVNPDTGVLVQCNPV